MKTAIAVTIAAGVLLAAIWDSPKVRHLRALRALRKGRDRDAR